MQPSMGTLHLPSSRVVKDSTPSRRRFLRWINFEIGESSPNLFLNSVNLYLVRLKHCESWTTGRFIVLLFSLFKSKSWPRKNKSPWWIFTQLYFCGSESWPNCYRKRWTNGESWPNGFVEKMNRGKDLRWVGSRCPLTHALNLTFNYRNVDDV